EERPPPSGVAPFVETVRRDEAAPPAHGVAERRLVVDGFAARIDQQRKVRGSFTQEGRKHQRAARNRACPARGRRLVSAGSAPRYSAAGNWADRHSRTKP